MKKAAYLIFFISYYFVAFSQAPRILIVNAHPDDESGVAATAYKVTKEMGGTVELVVITNGEAGYKYSLLAEEIYGQKLTTEATGRKYLPKIRKKELKKGCHWVGIEKIYHFNQLDTHYTLDPDTVLTSVWDVAKVKKQLTKLITKNKYDYIFCLLPTPETHGHHKAASILALETVKALPEGIKKPIVLGVSGGMKNDTTPPKVFTGLPNYPVTAIKEGKSSFQLDRTIGFGHNNKLNYKILANWLIAEHKSQGTMQTYMNMGDNENFWYFDMNAPERKAETATFFEKLRDSRKQSEFIFFQF